MLCGFGALVVRGRLLRSRIGGNGSAKIEMDRGADPFDAFDAGEAAEAPGQFPAAATAGLAVAAGSKIRSRRSEDRPGPLSLTVNRT